MSLDNLDQDKIVFGCTDYGHVIMSQATALTKEDVAFHLQLYDKQCTRKIDNSKYSKHQFQLAKPFTIRSEYIEEESFTRKFIRRVQRRKKVSWLSSVRYLTKVMVNQAMYDRKRKTKPSEMRKKG